MPENPLLPNRQLQRLYTGMLRARDLNGARRSGMEAILATVAQQLEPGDAVLPFAHADTLGVLLQPSKRGVSAASVLAPAVSPLAFAAGVAAGARLAGAERLVAAILDTRHPEPNWPALLGHVQQDRLPLIVICPAPAVAPASSPGENALTWTSLNKLVRKLRFPVLTVDGADAVAMYRAMQESVLRARHGDGPALLWCLMPVPAKGRLAAGNTADLPPLARLERYLSARRIALPKAGSKS